MLFNLLDHDISEGKASMMRIIQSLRLKLRCSESVFVDGLWRDRDNWNIKSCQLFADMPAERIIYINYEIW